MIDNTAAVLPKEQRLESQKELRAVYCQALIRAAEENPEIVAVEVDVMHSMGTTDFARHFPERSLNCGIQEANAVCLAAAMSLEGFIPFFHAFGPFATRRVFDQVFLSCGYQNANVKIIGGDAGIAATSNGGTHMPLEDISLMRTIPNMAILEPTDTVAMTHFVPMMVNHSGNVYCRSSRKKVTQVYSKDAQFAIGQASLLREGGDVVIFSAGLLLSEALDAADALQEEGIQATVVDLYSIQPVDAACIRYYASQCGCAVTVENQNICGGLGSMVAELLGEATPVPLWRVGVRNSFGEVGTIPYLKEHFHLTAQDIQAACRQVIRRKEALR